MSEIAAMPQTVHAEAADTAALVVARASRTRRPNFTSAITHVALFTGICLQRFGLPFGSATISLSLPVLLLAAVWMIAARRAYAPAVSALLFALFAAWSMLSAIGGILAPDKRVGFSILSLAELWALYLPLLIRPRGDFDPRQVQRILLFYVRLCAVAGILQFGLQFVHIRLFSFVERLPALSKWTLEREFAVISPIRYGSSILRSNGFFLLEPSIFSQLLAFGILLDVFILARTRYLPLYLVAYLTSYSGTGVLCLGLTLFLIGFTSVKNASRVILVGIGGVMALSLFGFIFPSQVATYVGRVGELGSSQTSAHARYLAPLEEMKAFAGETRSLLGYGPGATARAASYTAGSGNAALQLFIDYGMVGASLFAAFLLSVFWRPRFVALSLILLINFQLGGGYLLVPPMVLLMVVSGVWGTEEPRRFSARVRHVTGGFARQGRFVGGKGSASATAPYGRRAG